MKLFKTIVATTLGLVLFTACNDNKLCTSGSGVKVEETRSVGNFSGIELQMPGTVYVESGTENSVTVKAASNLLNLIETHVEGNDLVIDVKEGECIKNVDDLTFYVTITELSKASIVGSGDIVGNGSIPSDGLTVEITGTGDVSLYDITPQNYFIRINGSGDVVLKGKGNSDRGDIQITGSGDVHASDLPTKTVDVEITGSGDAEVNALEKLDVRISGSGDVYYKGQPQITVDISGSGSVEKM